MRLLERNDAGEIRLTDYLLADLPPYAILSHTWGNEEITFKDLADGPDKRKAGYRKIQFCADQAWRDGLRFCWVDTCCIDKSSSAELQEAINSMFCWYRHAARCYVYLSDVSMPALYGEEDLSLEPVLLSTFRNSRWFTRGWTLQELLAPKSVEFFSREGLKMGTRKTLESQISAVTGIPTKALQGSSMTDFTLEERTGWMDKRHTTRPEDKAYAMLGILDICMPLLYGEGRDKAFQRLLKLANEAVVPVAVQTMDRSSRDCMESISFPEMHSRWHQISNGADKTLDWLTGNAAFLRWKESDSGFLWVKGKPGCGKSTLMKHMANLPDWNGQNVARHFITARNSPIEMSVEAVCRTLLHQLLPLCPAYFRSLTKEFQHRQTSRGNFFEGRWKWQGNELKEHLERLLSHTDMPHVYIFVDALDELGEGPAALMVAYFSDIISRARSGPKLVHICVACRDFPLIALDGLSISVDKQNAADISHYVDSRAKIFNLDERYDAVLHFLREKANGVFLWITLVLPSVLQMCRKRRRVADILEEVRKLPADLHTLYQTLLDGVPAADQKRALRLFQWLCFLPVTLDENSLVHVVALIENPLPGGSKDPVSDADISRQRDDLGIQVTDISCGLAEYTSASRSGRGSRVAQLIHQSVADYLLLSGGLQRLDSASADPRTSACLYVLKSIDEFQNLWYEAGIMDAQSPEMLWTAMAPICDTLEGGPPLVVESAVNMFRHRPAESKKGSSALHILYHNRLINSFNLFLSRPDGDINAEGDRQETLFFHTLSRDDFPTAKKLLATGRVDVNRPRDDGCSILLFLIYNCKPLSLCSWLLSCPGVDLHARNLKGETGVHLAILNARTEVVRMLLDKSPGLATIANAEGETPIAYALKLQDSAYHYGRYVRPSWLGLSEDHAYISEDPAGDILQLLLDPSV